MVITALLLIVDPLAAARAGAGLVPAAPSRAVHRPLVRRLDAGRPSEQVTVRRHTAPTITVPRVAVPKIAAAAAAHAPTMCEAVVAAVVWPSGWAVGCAGPRPGLLGLTNPNGSTTLYVRADESLSMVHVVALHEAGHAWDLARLTKARIARWCARRGCDGARFFSGGTGGPGWGQPGGAEDWAAVWDACHGGEYDRSYLGLGPPSPGDCAVQDALVGYPRARAKLAGDHG